MRISSTKSMSPKMRFFFSRLFPLPFIIAGAIVLYLGCQNMLRAKESVDWPTAQGAIQNSSVESSRSDDGTTYHAEIRYTFKVAKTTHSGNTVAFGDYGSSNSSHAQHIVNRYPKGKEVTVYYKQKDPDLCVLEPGIKGQTWFLPGFGLIFFLVGSLMAIFLPRIMKQPPTTEPSDENKDDFLTEPVKP